jgi:hypothetical protein
MRNPQLATRNLTQHSQPRHGLCGGNSNLWPPEDGRKVVANMTFPNSTPERPAAPPGPQAENHQDVIPPSERGQDAAQTEIEHGLTLDSARPLTDEERKAADRDTRVGERVYAPASERVPKDPVPGHRDVINHPDTHTPEREAVTNSSTEPSFTRVARPSTYTSQGFEVPTPDSWDGAQDRRKRMFFGIGFSWFTVICTGVGVWLFMRWRRERNKPINRLRRQAQELRERMPDPEEAVRPAMGLTTAMLSLLLVLWRQSQMRSKTATKKARRATESLSDVDWQKRLMKLKNYWSPGRLELEKFQISRH